MTQIHHVAEILIKNYFTLYQRYVTNTNKLQEISNSKAKDATNPEYAELKRRFGFEFNGMRLHEYYFENLGGKTSINKSGNLSKKLAETFGSYEFWEQYFKATVAIRGIGWTILYQDYVTGGVINQMI